MSAQELADIFGYDSASMAKLIKRLMTRGLIERAPVPQKTGKGIMYALRIKETAQTKELKSQLGLDKEPGEANSEANKPKETKSRKSRRRTVSKKPKS